MSVEDETRRAIDELIGAVSRADIEAAAAVASPDAELVSLLGQVEGGLYRGPEGVREWFRDVIGAFDDFVTEIEAYERMGDAIVIQGRARGRARASGIELDWGWAALARTSGGKISRFAIYADREELMRGEGLEGGTTSPAAGPS